HNLSKFLIGLEVTPKYILPLAKEQEVTDAIYKHWCKRWLLNRIKKPNILEQLEDHTTYYPVTHGARVPMVEDSDGSEEFYLWEAE
ncbi:MAG: hypothetical protein VYB73_03495, partial [Verrucomicrobiota bacterium]|nr:hypothetical protein [Verrucomicrobiota bacterium]